jgi:carboxylesterase
MQIVPGAEPWSSDGNEVGVLVIHGFTGSPVSVKPWAQRLAAEGWTVTVPRLPGHGTTWQDANTTTWQDWYGEVDNALADLKARCSTVFVMGLSMGGTLTLRLAEQHGDDIRGIVLVNPSIHTERWDRHLLPIIHRFIPSFPGISNDIAKPGQDEGAYDKIPVKAAYQLSQMWADVKANLGRVIQPMLLFRSSVDHVVEPSNAAYVLLNVSTEDKEEVVLSDSYHVATLDYDAEIIISDSIEFVRRLSA